MNSDLIKDIECLDDKGNVKFIPEHLANSYTFMNRHHLAIRQKPNIPAFEVETPNLDLKTEEDFTPETIADEPVKDERTLLFAQLDAKGIAYKKTFGVTKLKELLNQ